MTTQLVLTSSLFTTAGVVAAVDAGLLGQPDRRILLQSKHSLTPELVQAPAEVAGAERVLTVFDRVITLNDLLAPAHPMTFSPLTGPDRGTQALVLQRLLRRYWDLGDEPVELVLESLTGNPAQWLCAVFHDSPITVTSDGLMAYGPTRTAQPLTVGQRIDALVHVDLLPGIKPVVLHELGVPTRPVPQENLIKVFADLADAMSPGTSTWTASRPDTDAPIGLVLGQYLADLGLMTRSEESALHADLVRAAVSAGAGLIMFKPHPAASPSELASVRQASREVGVELIIVTDSRPAEVLIAQLSPAVVAAAFSTALVTARTFYDTTIVSVGTEQLLRRLEPYANSNRIPITVVDALTRPDTPYRTPWELQTLVDAVAYEMQPRLLGGLAPGAAAFWDRHPAGERARYGPPAVSTRAVRRIARRGLRAASGTRAFATVERASRRHPLRRLAGRAVNRLARL